MYNYILNSSVGSTPLFGQSVSIICFKYGSIYIYLHSPSVASVQLAAWVAAQLRGWLRGCAAGCLRAVGGVKARITPISCSTRRRKSSFSIWAARYILVSRRGKLAGNQSRSKLRFMNYRLNFVDLEPAQNSSTSGNKVNFRLIFWNSGNTEHSANFGKISATMSFWNFRVWYKIGQI